MCFFDGKTSNGCLDDIEEEIRDKEYADFKLSWSKTKKFDKLYSSYIRELKYRVKAGE